MKVCDSLLVKLNHNFITAIIGENAVITSEKSISSINISKYVEVHLTEKSSNQTTKTALKWAHVAISNAIRVFYGIHHKRYT